MKNILILMLFIILLTGCSKDDDNIAPNECNFTGFKYYNGSQDNLGELSNEYILSYFYVKVFDEDDYTDLNTVLSETNTEFVRQNEFMPKWYTLKATKNPTGDALKMTNYFYETGLFEFSEPDITKYPVE